MRRRNVRAGDLAYAIGGGAVTPFVRQVRSARASRGALVITETRSELRASQGRVELRSRPVRGATGSADAEALRQHVLATIPPERREQLEVEVGSVETWLRGQRGSRRRCSYVLVTAGRTLLMLRRRMPHALPFRWSGAADEAEIHPDLPVVLGPSAILELALRLDPRKATPPLAATRVERSPYPPHDARLLRNAFPVRTALAESVSPLLDDERLSRPPGVLDDLEPRGVAVMCASRARAPREALVVDSLAGGPGAAGDVVRWEAEWTLVDAAGTCAGRSELRFDASADDVVRRIRAALGPSAPAMRCDSVDGELYGTAPPTDAGFPAAALLGGRL